MLRTSSHSSYYNKLYLSYNFLIPKHLFNRYYVKKPISFGDKLRNYRIDNGLKIKELAIILTVSETTIINWEKRGYKPRNIENIKILCENKDLT